MSPDAFKTDTTGTVHSEWYIFSLIPLLSNLRRVISALGLIVNGRSLALQNAVLHFNQSLFFLASIPFKEPNSDSNETWFWLAGNLSRSVARFLKGEGRMKFQITKTCLVSWFSEVALKADTVKNRGVRRMGGSRTPGIPMPMPLLSSSDDELTM